MFAASESEGLGAAVRDVRIELGWTHDELAAEVARVRARRGMPAIESESIRRQVIAIQQGRKPPGPQWRSLLAEALDSSEERLFGLVVESELPRPMLIEARVTPYVIETILERRHVHARAENLYGPRHAQLLVAADMATIAQLVRAARGGMRAEARRAAALVAELGGWIAQDSGDPRTALDLTRDAEDYAGSAEPELRAMILMRRSNIITHRDPVMAMDLASDALDLVAGRDAGLLPAAIARQLALAALAAGDRQAFLAHADVAAELAQAHVVEGDLADYATPAYVASETASGLLIAGRATEAGELLARHVDAWPTPYQRDHAVAVVRLLRALVIGGDYRSALERVDDALRGVRVAPSVRARNELRLLRKVLADRSRSDRSLPITELRRRVKDVLMNDTREL